MAGWNEKVDKRLIKVEGKAKSTKKGKKKNTKDACLIKLTILNKWDKLYPGQMK